MKRAKDQNRQVMARKGKGRRRLQFTLRTVFVVTTILALLLSWLGVSINKDRRRAAAIEQLYAARAHVETEWRGPGWLAVPMGKLGYTPFRRVLGVGFYTPKPSAETLALLHLFPEM